MFSCFLQSGNYPVFKVKLLKQVDQVRSGTNQSVWTAQLEMSNQHENEWSVDVLHWMQSASDQLLYFFILFHFYSARAVHISYININVNTVRLTLLSTLSRFY